MDPETEFLLSDRTTGSEWEVYKENVRPLKRGRNVAVLNTGLSPDPAGLLKARRESLLRAIDDYSGDDPLEPWLRCIRWVQDAFPAAGDSSGLLLIYEKCLRAFWHSPRYKNDLRFLKLWLEYAQHCADAQVIYAFLEVNEIGNGHAVFYISHAAYLESKNNVKLANQVLNLGISRNARPIESLKDAFRRFIARSMRRPVKAPIDNDSAEKLAGVRSFGTVLSRGQNRMSVDTESIFDNSNKNGKRIRGQAAPISIFKDSSVVDDSTSSDGPKTEASSWRVLGSRAERNKENNALPTKWKSYKVPQRPGARTVGASRAIEVFVDEELEEKHKRQAETGRAASSNLGRESEGDLKKETELLRENPLRNFPPSSLPR